MRRSRARLARASFAVSLALALAGACNYEGRSLELFPGPPLVDDLTRCSSAADCPDDRAFCAEGLCVECLSDAECRGNRPACLAGACVTCAGAEHCADGNACNVAAQRCAPTCGDAAACDGPTSTCDIARGFCVQCVSDDDCPDRARPACERAAGQCVACTTAEHCGDARPVCDLARRQCVECSADLDCANAGRCDAMGRCQRDCTPELADAGCAPRAPGP